MEEQIVKIVREHGNLEDYEMIDAASHGADSGFSGFIYKTELDEFYDKNASLIQRFSQQEAEEFGYENWFQLYASFGRSDMLSQEDGYKQLAGWYMLETAGRYLEQ